VEGIGFGVAGGNIDGFWFELGLLRRGLTRPTESGRGGAERLVLVRGRVGGGEGSGVRGYVCRFERYLEVGEEGD